MLVYIYDKSLDGLLSAVFDAYSRRESPECIAAAGEPLPMFTEQTHDVYTSAENAARVWSGLAKRADKYICNMLMCVWLSEEAGSDDLIFRYLRKVFDSPKGVVFNFADDDILEVKQLARKVSIEGERMRQFVRFQKAADGTYFAPVSPQYNALPLAVNHFCDRFRDQKWLVYDTRRHYGYAYDLHEVKEIVLDSDTDLSEGRLPEWMQDSDDALYQEMWRGYYKSATIKERKNTRQQKRCMPVRYWKYMTEHQ